MFAWCFCFFGENKHINIICINSSDMPPCLISSIFTGPFLCQVLSWQSVPAATAAASQHFLCPLTGDTLTVYTLFHRPISSPSHPTAPFIHQWAPLCPCQFTFYSWKKQRRVQAGGLTFFASSAAKVPTWGITVVSWMMEFPQLSGSCTIALAKKEKGLHIPGSITEDVLYLFALQPT